MKNILLIGSNSLLGERLLQTTPCAITGLDRSQLDLTDWQAVNSVDIQQYDTLFIVAAEGTGWRLHFHEHDPQVLKNIVDANITGKTRLIQRWIQEKTSGTIVYIGSDNIVRKRNTKIMYWSTKQYMIELIGQLRTEYPDFRFVTVNPPRFEQRSDRTRNRGSAKDLPVDTVVKWIWFALENDVTNIDGLTIDTKN